jgi:hypothetical protein
MLRKAVIRQTQGLGLAIAIVLMAMPQMVGAGQGVHAAAEKSACQKLKAKHDLAPANKVKLVKRKNEDGGTDLKGCVLPDGKIRTIASSNDHSSPYATTVEEYGVIQVAGHQALVYASSSSQYGGGDSTFVYNIENGKRYSVASTCSSPEGPCGESRTSKRAFVNAKGQSAALVRDNPTATIRVLGFSSKGVKTKLDSGTSAEIPKSSLALDGHEVSWTHSGEPRSATLSG